jgi:hypothetical protein
MHWIDGSVQMNVKHMYDFVKAKVDEIIDTTLYIALITNKTIILENTTLVYP